MIGNPVASCDGLPTTVLPMPSRPFFGLVSKKRGLISLRRRLEVNEKWEGLKGAGNDPWRVQVSRD